MVSLIYGYALAVGRWAVVRDPNNDRPAGLALIVDGPEADAGGTDEVWRLHNGALCQRLELAVIDLSDALLAGAVLLRDIRSGRYGARDASRMLDLHRLACMARQVDRDGMDASTVAELDAVDLLDCEAAASEEALRRFLATGAPCLATSLARAAAVELGRQHACWVSNSIGWPHPAFRWSP